LRWTRTWFDTLTRMPADQATVALTSVEVGPATGIVIGVPWVITTMVP
jgi:hypothetical protein